MARPRLTVGTHGDIAVTAQVQDEAGRWITAPQGQRAQRWRARTKYRDLDGKVRDVERFAPTKAKATNALKDALAQRVAPATSTGDIRPGTTVADAAALWERVTLDEGTLATSSIRVYRTVLHRHITGNGTHAPGPLAALTVREVNVPAIERALSKVAKDSGAGAAKTSRSIYRGIFRMAVRHGAIAHNPVTETAVPRVERTDARRDTSRALTAQERADLLRYIYEGEGAGVAQATDVGDLIAFMLGTGVRIGEACALRWDRVDLDQATAEVMATVVRDEHGRMAVQEQTKTKAGTRVVHLPEWLVERLRDRVQREPANALGLVFASPLGKVRDQSNTNRNIRRVLDGAGLGWATSHTFRRTAATILDGAGLSARAIATALGHAAPSMTQNVYMKPDRTDARAAAIL